MFQGHQVADWGFVVIMSIVHGRLRRTVATLLVFVGISLAGAACGGGGDDDAADPPSTSGPSTTTTTEPTTTTLSEQDQKIEAAKAAYRAYLQAFQAAATAPVTPRLPELQAVMTGLQQSDITANLEGLQARGEAVRLPDNSQKREEVIAAHLQADGSVLLKTCEVDDAIVYDVATGAVVDDDIVTSADDITVVAENGVWKVADTAITEKWDGVVSCAG